MKKILALLLAFVMIFSLAACGQQSSGGSSGAPAASSGGDLAGTYDITVWVADKMVDLTKSQIDAFNSSNTDGIVFNATVEPVGEGDAATQMITDVEAGGDIFCFANDQFARLVQAGALSKLGVQAAEMVRSSNDSGAVGCATVGEDIWAYPITSDNGYFMYYDKSVVPEEDIGSLEKIIADCEAAGKYFGFQLTDNGWYLAGFFFGTGCVSEWVTDNDGQFISIRDTFNSDKGMIAAKGMKKLMDSDCFLNSSSGADFDAGAAVIISGIWDSSTVKAALGDNFGAAPLPCYEVDGQSYHIGSYAGSKLMGVKPQTDAVKAAALHKLAQYLTGEECSLQRFKAEGWGPSNLAAQKNEAVQADPALAAFFAQLEYAIPQGQIHGSWWDLCKPLGQGIKDAESEADMQAALDAYTDSIKALFNMTEEEKEAWSVIGTVEGSNWDKDFPMAAAGDNVFKSGELNLYAGNEFKVRQGASWDVNFGADGNLNGPNVAVEEDGLYVITLTIVDEATGNITLEKVGEPTAAAPVVEKTEEELNAWSVIGSLCDTSWDTDFPMAEVSEGVFKSGVLELKAGDELKCRQGADWAVNYGIDGADGANLVVEEDGAYVVVLDLAAGTVSIEAAEHSWGVVGSMTGWGGDPDFAMTEVSDGVFESEAITLKAGDELKVRQDSDWGVNYGTDGRDGANLKVEADGSYIVVLDIAAESISIKEA